MTPKMEKTESLNSAEAGAKLNLTKAERTHTEKALAYLGLRYIAGDICDLINERRAAQRKATKAKQRKTLAKANG